MGKYLVKCNKTVESVGYYADAQDLYGSPTTCHRHRGVFYKKGRKSLRENSQEEQVVEALVSCVEGPSAVY